MPRRRFACHLAHGGGAVPIATLDLVNRQRFVFTGHIAGVGTESGVRLVIGRWPVSPFGSFADVMVQTPDDERILLAPSSEVADFVSSTYQFDRIELGEVSADLTSDRLTVGAPGLDVTVSIGAAAPVDRLLRLVPGRLATAPWWLAAINPVAALIVPGVRTAGSAGNGRREYYRVRRSRRVIGAQGTFCGRDLGGLAPLLPAVSFGFSSAPPDPQIVSVTTTIDMPASVAG